MRPDALVRDRSRYEKTTWLFALAFSLLISHELDAMIRSEWALFPGFKALAPDVAADLFNLLHVPLLAPIIWLLTSGSATARHRTMVVSEVFFLGHAIAHALFRGADRYEFEAPVETITVFGAAVASAGHLTFLLADRDAAARVRAVLPGRADRPRRKT